MKIELEGYKERAKRIIQDAIEKNKDLNTAILAEVDERYTDEQIKRLVEIVNKSVYNSYYDKAEDKRFSFKLADFEEIKKKKTFIKVAELKGSFDYRCEEESIREMIEKIASHPLLEEIKIASKSKNGFFCFSEKEGEFGYEAEKVARKLDETFDELVEKISAKVSGGELIGSEKEMIKKAVALSILGKQASGNIDLMMGVGQYMKMKKDMDLAKTKVQELKSRGLVGEYAKTMGKETLDKLTKPNF